MDDYPKTEVEHIGHQGLITSIFDTFCISKKIDALLPKTSNNQKISHAQAIQSMVHLGLGFTGKRLYSAGRFFKGTPTGDLIGEGVEHVHINYDVLAKALDAIHAYGSQKFFTDVAFLTLLENNLLTKFIRMDSTSHSLYGRRYSKNGDIEVCFGHSKGRKDLPQVVQLLIITDNGLPLWSETFTGSESDREIFQTSAKNVQKYFRDNGASGKFTLIADSALYSKKFLLNKAVPGYWITRVPETVRDAKKLVEAEKRGTWLEMDDGIKFKEEIVKHKGVRQRWIIVTHRGSHHKEIATLEKRLNKEEEAIEKKVKKLNAKIFLGHEALNLEFRRLEGQHPEFKFRKNPTGVYKKKRTKSSSSIEARRAIWRAVSSS